MSSYGHPQSYGDAGYDAYDSYDRYQDSYADDSPPTSPTPSYSAAARAAAVGAAPTGRARVAAPDAPAHRYDWSGAGGRRPAAGRASVPVSPAGGAAAGRATVRPGGPGGPGGRFGGPAGPGPGGRPKRKKKRHWLRNTLLSMLAVTVISVGGGMVALSYYVDSVPPPDLVDLPEGSTIYYGNGKSMAALQEVNRTIIDTTVPELENARLAVIAAEDNTFYDHSGVDFQGIVRAAWNNFTGGEKQGASTIDQQYAGAVAGTRSEASYSRKLKEAAMAYKMNQEHSKAEILDFYLNQVYFGRGAHGVEAAAKAYYGKGAAELTVEEATVLAGCIRYPDDGTGLCPYDPLHDPENPETAELRFRSVLGQLVEMGELGQGDADAMVLPETVEPKDPAEPFKGAQGAIVRQVKWELEGMGITDVTTGGYRITTTIDPDIQKAARDAARRKNGKTETPHWVDMPENVAAGLVAIDPATGGVLAYYGGDKGGIGYDLAGPNKEEDTGEWYGGRPPGSSGKIYTLIAEMREGVAFDSHWTTTPYHPEWIDNPEEKIQNAGRGAASECEGRAPNFCTLEWNTIKSFNVAFAKFAEAVPDQQGPARIVEAARDAGVTRLTGAVYDEDAGGNVPEVVDLAELDLADTRKYFDYPVAYGQYEMTVLDHANGVATLAARGVYNKAHFVSKVEKKVNGEWEQVEGDRINPQQNVEQAHADAITGVLSKIPNDSILNRPLANGRPAAAKTGTWEFKEGDTIIGNSDAWVVGYTPQIATAVWVGDGTEDPAPIKDQFGSDIGSSGLPAVIWQQFMNDAHAAKDFDPQQFPQAPQIGEQQHPYANGVPPEPEPNRLCRGRFQPPIICDEGGDDGDDGDDGGQDGGGDQGGATDGGLLPAPPDPDDNQVLPPDDD